MIVAILLEEAQDTMRINSSDMAIDVGGGYVPYNHELCILFKYFITHVARIA